jgi:DNA-binding NtrC family response regulator
MRPGRPLLDPFRPDHLFAFGFQVRRAFHHIFEFIIGTSSAATRLRARVWESIFTHDVRRYQRALFERMGDIISLITGPSGTGKELVARAIAHSQYIPFDEKQGKFSNDFSKNFYPLNLSALSPTLIESELFGHHKGAFTGALQDRKGYFEECGKWGTVFLDEIGDVDADIQLKLLRVLQTRQFQPLGGTQLRSFLGKIIVATNRNLVKEMKEGRFREDFYFRLCADRIETPTLREILAEDPDELSFLVHYVTCRVAGESESESLAQEVCDWVTNKLGREYSWPGNFRELEQCVRSILVHQEYHPQHEQNRDFFEQLEAGTLTAAQVLRHYVTRVYAKTRSYEKTSRMLELDPRTVKKHIDPDFLNDDKSA